MIHENMNTPQNNVVEKNEKTDPHHWMDDCVTRNKDNLTMDGPNTVREETVTI